MIVYNKIAKQNENDDWRDMCIENYDRKYGLIDAMYCCVYENSLQSSLFGYKIQY